MSNEEIIDAYKKENDELKAKVDKLDKNNTLLTNRVMELEGHNHSLVEQNQKLKQKYESFKKLIQGFAEML